MKLGGLLSAVAGSDRVRRLLGKPLGPTWRLGRCDHVTT